MATEVFTTEVVSLLDGTEVELRPLPVAKLRRFMRIWSDHLEDVSKKIAESERESEDNTPVKPFTQSDLTDAQYDTFTKLCALGLEGQLKDGKTEKQFLAYLEDILDEATIARILFVTGGLKLNNDPNPTTPV